MRDAAGHPIVLGTFQPTFLYESLWCLGVAAAVVLVDRRYQLGPGRAFALYVMLYTVGRGWIEYLRVDQATHILGLRLNDWTALIVFLGALTYFVAGRATGARRPGLRRRTPREPRRPRCLRIRTQRPLLGTSQRCKVSAIAGQRRPRERTSTCQDGDP